MCRPVEQDEVDKELKSLHRIGEQQLGELLKVLKKFQTSGNPPHECAGVGISVIGEAVDSAGFGVPDHATAGDDLQDLCNEVVHRVRAPELFELECWDWALDFRIRGGGTLSGIERTAESATA